MAEDLKLSRPHLEARVKQLRGQLALKGFEHPEVAGVISYVLDATRMIRSVNDFAYNNPGEIVEAYARVRENRLIALEQSPYPEDKYEHHYIAGLLREIIATEDTLYAEDLPLAA